MKSILDVERILQEDPEFERLVKKSGVVKTYFRPFTSEPTLNQASNAVRHFRMPGEIRSETNMRISNYFGVVPETTGDAFRLWFVENWSRWMKEGEQHG